ncbi:1-acyl-sn-glycerol-3-phosphate acyltransferase [Thermocoleostomius sinensis]|uniref:1-acyl-sn-glycerol-3-phosphate acyltransferase n=1 Tax=Thermocoleostomius sinensis A174 TaxID=2016057 RepID=A0A9E8Z840_9CYAN|nr:1-acyl-sn-glycerol-3-phosphate acyltransferase [Thermocoleostomius sinensis]WAL58225.1 1-acyl-sn-glycerol-3-phosphate acyltransferase [Thermocoleostomius sinensis A174]
MPRPRQFYPPQLDPTLVWWLQKIAPWLARLVYQLDVIISADPSVQLTSLKQKPCILLCNHPSFDDSIVLFLFSAYLEESFHYMTAYEQFLGRHGWLYQRLGAYSVQRGLADRDSVAQTLTLLSNPDNKLVIFPEGGCSFQNDTVMPFRPGAVQIGLQAMARCRKRGDPVPDLHLAPISLKYRYTGRMKPVIEKTLSQLEQALALPAQGDYYQRLRQVAARVLDQFEQEYGVVSAEAADWNQRITALKTQVLQRCEQNLNLTSSPGEPNRERVYRIRHMLDRHYSLSFREQQQQVDQHSPTATRAATPLIPPDTLTLDAMSKAMTRVLNFDAIYDGYVAEKPTPERFLDTLVRFEREVFNIDKPRPKAHRQAFLRVGQLVRLHDYLDAYSTDRAGTVAELVQQLQQTTQHNLDVLSEATARGISW